MAGIDILKALGDDPGGSTRVLDILDYVASAVIACDAHGKIQSANRAAATLTGYPSTELAGLSYRVLCPPVALAQIDAFFTGLGAGRADKIRSELVRKDGACRTVELAACKLGRAGLGAAMLLTIEDVTALTQLADSLRRKEANLAKAQEIAHLGSWEWDIVKDELHWSDEIYRLFGLVPRQAGFCLETFLNAVHADDRSLVRDRIDAALRARAPYVIDHRIVRADGEVRVVHEQGEVTRDDNGRPARMIGTVQDVTAQKEVERKLRQSEKLLQTIFKTSPEFIAIARLADGRVVNATDSFAHAMGLEVNDVIGKTSAELGMWSDIGERERIWGTLRATGRVSNAEIRMEIRGEDERNLLVSAERIDIDNEPHAILIGRDITERKHTEKLLSESAERFRSQYKGIPLPTYSWRAIDDDLVLVDFNDAAEAATQGRVGEFLGKRASEVLADRPGLREGLARCAREKTTVRIEGAPCMFTTGQSRYVISTMVPVPPNIVMVHVEDITDRRRAEEGLRKSELRLRQMFDANLGGIALADADATVVEANDAFLDIIGYTRDDLRDGRVSMIEITAPEYRCLTREAIRAIHEGRKVRPYEKEYVRKDGGRVPVLVGKSQIGRGMIVSFVVDLTELKQAEERIRFQANLLGVVDHAVVALDSQRRVTYWNRFAEQLYGWPAEEAVGKHLADDICLGTAKELEVLISRALGGEGGRSEAPCQRRDGSRFLAGVTATPVRNTDDQVVGVILVSADITARRQMEEDITKAQKLESIGVLAGGIAHDFNNVLTAILGNVSLAKMFVREGDEAAEALAEAEKGFWRARALTNQLLTFARGGAPLRKPGSLAHLLRDTARFALSGANVGVQLDIDERLSLVSFDPGQISQAINNLVINAKQAMPGGGTLIIKAENVTLRKGEVPSLRAGEYVKVTFSDQGVGIPREHLDKIFDPYFTTKAYGSGLGLAVTYSIIKKHDGHITVESEVGRGSSFCVYLPAVAGEGAGSDTGVPQAPKGQGRILLMDDEPMIRALGRRMLDALGYDAEVAATGEEAIELYRQARDTRPFAAVILDLTVPGAMGGRECIARLKELDPAVVAVVSSGYSNDPVLADPHAYGFSAVVSKPYRPVDLGEALRAVLVPPGETGERA